MSSWCRLTRRRRYSCGFDDDVPAGHREPVDNLLPQLVVSRHHMNRAAVYARANARQHGFVLRILSQVALCAGRTFGASCHPLCRRPARRLGDTLTRGQLQHPAVADVGDVDVAGAVHRYTVGVGEAGERQLGRGAHPHWQLQHPVGAVVGDVEVAGAVHRHTLGVGEVGERQLGRGARPRRQLQHATVAVVAEVGDVEVAGAVHRHTLGPRRSVNGNTSCVVAPAGSFSTPLVP